MNNPAVRAVVFDYGGVLDIPADEQALKEHLENQAQSLGIESGGLLLKHIFGGEDWLLAEKGRISEAEFWSRRLTPLGFVTPLQQHNFRQRLFSKHSAIHRDMRAMMVQLKAHNKLGILSNTAIANFSTWITENTDAPAGLDLVVGSADIGLAKPDPAIFHYLLERLQVQPGETLFIDDNQGNVTSALQIGMQAILFTTPAALRDELAKCQLID